MCKKSVNMETLSNSLFHIVFSFCNVREVAKLASLTKLVFTMATGFLLEIPTPPFLINIFSEKQRGKMTKQLK